MGSSDITGTSDMTGRPDITGAALSQAGPTGAALVTGALLFIGAMLITGAALIEGAMGHGLEATVDGNGSTEAPGDVSWAMAMPATPRSRVAANNMLAIRERITVRLLLR